MKVKCRVILLQSKPGEGFPFLLNVNGRGDNLYKPSKGYYYTGFYLKEQQFEPYHLYIVSDEEIKKGDWCYSERANNFYKEPDPEFANASNYIWKIIASTNSDLNLPKISEQFLDDYMFKHNIKKKIEEVEMEYEEEWIDPNSNTIL